MKDISHIIQYKITLKINKLQNVKINSHKNSININNN